MSVISDKLKNLITDQVEGKMQLVGSSVDLIVKNTRLGKSQGKEIKDTLELISTAIEIKEAINSMVDTVTAVQQSLEAGKTVAETTEKASTIGSALNPGSAAIAIAQRFIIMKFEQESKDIKDVLNVVPYLIESFDEFLTNSRIKIAKSQKEKEQTDRIAEENKNMLK